MNEIKIGQKFGKLTVINETPRINRNGNKYVEFKCDCGNVEWKHWSSVKSGKTIQCSECRNKSHRTPINIGEKYKHWTVIGNAERFGKQLRYKCRCDCGHEQYMTAAALNSKTRWFRCKHCATLQTIEERAIERGKVGDLTLSRLNYIKSKAELRHISFNLTTQYLWDLYLKQNKKCAITGDTLASINNASLDRIDSSKGYEEGNVQWTTKQANLSKHIMSMTELKEFCKKVLNNDNQQPSQPLTKLEGSETNS